VVNMLQKIIFCLLNQQFFCGGSLSSLSFFSAKQNVLGLCFLTDHGDSLAYTLGCLCACVRVCACACVSCLSIVAQMPQWIELVFVEWVTIEDSCFVLAESQDPPTERKISPRDWALEPTSIKRFTSHQLNATSRCGHGCCGMFTVEATVSHPSSCRGKGRKGKGWIHI